MVAQSGSIESIFENGLSLDLPHNHVFDQTALKWTPDMDLHHIKYLSRDQDHLNS